MPVLPTVLRSPPGRVRTLVTTLRRELGLPVEAIRTDIPPRPRRLFPIVSQAINQVRPVEEMRWITFGHLEADECGAMNLFLAAAPHGR